MTCNSKSSKVLGNLSSLILSHCYNHNNIFYIINLASIDLRAFSTAEGANATADYAGGTGWKLSLTLTVWPDEDCLPVDNCCKVRGLPYLKVFAVQASAGKDARGVTILSQYELFQSQLLLPLCLRLVSKHEPFLKQDACERCSLYHMWEPVGTPQSYSDKVALAPRDLKIQDWTKLRALSTQPDSQEQELGRIVKISLRPRHHKTAIGLRQVVKLKSDIHSSWGSI